MSTQNRKAQGRKTVDRKIENQKQLMAVWAMANRVYAGKHVAPGTPVDLLLKKTVSGGQDWKVALAEGRTADAQELMGDCKKSFTQAVRRLTGLDVRNAQEAVSELTGWLEVQDA